MKNTARGAPYTPRTVKGYKSHSNSINTEKKKTFRDAFNMIFDDGGGRAKQVMGDVERAIRQLSLMKGHGQRGHIWIQKYKHIHTGARQ